MKFRTFANLFLHRIGEHLEKHQPPQTNLKGANLMDDLEFLCRGIAKPLILDVGAHKGETAVRLLKKFPNAQIHSFEPHPETFKTLKKNLGERSNLTLVNAACGSVAGREIMFTNSASFTNSLLRNSDTISQWAPPRLVEEREQIVVDVKTLDDYCRDQGIQFINLLKMDAQGYEKNIMKGAKKLLESNSIHFIWTEILFVELYKKQAYFHELYEYLTQNNFSFASMHDYGYNKKSELTCADALFINKNQMK